MVTSSLVGRRSYLAPDPDEYLWYRHLYALISIDTKLRKLG
jgi:hypothetical protein